MEGEKRDEKLSHKLRTPINYCSQLALRIASEKNPRDDIWQNTFEIKLPDLQRRNEFANFFTKVRKVVDQTFRFFTFFIYDDAEQRRL